MKYVFLCYMFLTGSRHVLTPILTYYHTCGNKTLRTACASQVFAYAQVPYDKAITWLVLRGFLLISTTLPQKDQHALHTSSSSFQNKHFLYVCSWRPDDHLGKVLEQRTQKFLIRRPCFII